MKALASTQICLPQPDLEPRSPGTKASAALVSSGQNSSSEAESIPNPQREEKGSGPTSQPISPRSEILGPFAPTPL